MLCENPVRKTGLTTFFQEFIAHAVRLCPDVSWVLFLGPDQEWPVADGKIELVRRFPANDQLNRRLLADHFLVAAAARAHGAAALVTIGFVPFRKCLPTVMHMFSLQHLDRRNRLGTWRELYRTLVMRWSMPRADLIITGSRFAASQVLAVYPACQGRLLTSYEGLQHAQFHPEAPPQEAARLRERFGLAPGYFLWLSNFYPYKQADLLLQGYARLEKTIRDQHPLVMVGGDWFGMRAQLEQQVAALQIGEHVKFPGWVEDPWLAPLYRQALAFCLPSREETFGKCVSEAMACGTPCILNDIEVMREVSGGHALILDFRDQTRVTEALRRMTAEPDLHRRLSEQGRLQATQFSYEKLTVERIAAMRQLVERGRRP